jgi:hypothetical protein
MEVIVMNNEAPIRQPLQPEDISPEEKEAQKREIHSQDLTLNPGDRVPDSPMTLKEKARRVAVNAPDITGDHIVVPTYFIVEENGEKRALHHVRDAEEISDVIRQARMDENGNRTWW